MLATFQGIVEITFGAILPINQSAERRLNRHIARRLRFLTEMMVKETTVRFHTQVIDSKLRLKSVHGGGESAKSHAGVVDQVVQSLLGCNSNVIFFLVKRWIFPATRENARHPLL